MDLFLDTRLVNMGSLISSSGVSLILQKCLLAALNHIYFDRRHHNKIVSTTDKYKRDIQSMIIVLIILETNGSITKLTKLAYHLTPKQKEISNYQQNVQIFLRDEE